MYVQTHIGGDVRLPALGPKGNTWLQKLSVMLAAVGLWLATSNAAAWTITRLGDADFNALAINNGGQVLGRCNQGTGTCVWSEDSGVEDLRIPSFLPIGFNNRGQIIGLSGVSPFLYGVLWSSGTLWALPCTPPKCAGPWPSGINDSGWVAGMMWTVIDDPDIGVQYQDSVAALWAGGEAQNLGLLPYGYYSWATAINNNGQVVGYGNWVNSDDGSAGISALLWSQGGMQSLGTLPGGTYSIATGINNEGQVIGWSDGVAPSTFLWSSETGMQPLAPLPGGNSTGPFGMNDSRQVVGWSNVEDQFDSHVVLWTDGKIVDLTTLPEVLGAGWSLSAASGINNAGQIVGMGTLMVGGTTGGEPASFLLSPGEAGLSAKTAGPCPPAGQGATDDPNRPNRCDPGNPINAATGNKYQIETDYVGAGVHPLIFQRYYNSATGFSTGVIGAHWRHSYERSIIWRGNTAVVMRPDGKQYVFRQSGPDWVGDPDVMDSLSRTDSSWTYTTAPSNEVETYDASGQLMSISDRAGITQRLDRDPHGRLLSVTHLLTGARLVFVYDSLGDIAAISDPAGNTFTYAYEDSDLTSVTYPGNMPAPADPPVRTYIYNEPQNTSGLNRPHYLTGIIDEKGSRFATYQYDIQGRGISTQHAGGAGAYTIAYNSDGTSSVTDPLSKTRTYTFQTLFQVPRDTGLDQPCLTCGMASATAYDGNGFLSSATNFNHVTTTYSHNARGLEVRRTEASGTTLARSISTAWHPSFRLPIQIAEPQRITTFSYDAVGALTSKTIQATNDADGSQGFNASANGSAQTWTYTNTYSSVTPGLLIQQVVDGPRTDVADLTTYVWDELGNLISVTNALGQTSTLSNYDAHGRARQVTDPNGLVTTLAYDVRGRLISRNVGGELTSYAYDPAGQLVQVTAPDGSWLGYTHDAAHRLIKIQDNLGDQIVYTLDAMGNRVQEQVLDANGTLAVARSSAYNSLDRLAQSIGGAKPATEVTSYGYDAQGNLTSVTDPLGHLTSNLYDALNRLTQVISPSASGSASGATVQYQYDGLDQITQVTDPRSLATRYSLDGLGNLTQLQSPDSGATSSSYDAAGNLISQTDARGVTGTFRYDALNRMTQAVYAPPAGSNIAAVTLLYSYDQGAFGIGHLTGMSDPGGTTAYSYDQRGRLIQDQHGVGGATYAVSYSYDSFGRLSRITYPSGRTLNYGFDTLGRVRQIDTSYQGTTQSVVSNVAYQPFGAAVSFSFGNAQGYSRSYDLDGRVTGYNLGASSRTLSYDAASRLTSVSTPNAALNQSYGYDNLNRLVSWVSASSSQGYGYDVAGNRTTLSIGVNTYSYSYAPSSNRLGATSGPNAPRSYSYDAAGNIVADTARTFSYDARGRLIQASYGSAGVSFQINALGQRVSKTPTGLPMVVFHYDARGRLMAESAAQGAVLREYVWLNDQPVGLIDYDLDQDGVPDVLDNCITVANPSQWDADGDGIGEICDGDLNRDGAINQADLQLLTRAVQGLVPKLPRYDLNGDGLVNATDLALLAQRMGLARGPSGLKGQAPPPRLYFVYTDHLNSPRSLVNAQGVEVWRWDSLDPFGGNGANQDPDGDHMPLVFNLRFPGQYFDRETGLNYNYYRDYDSSTGRYVESDPIGLAGGVNTYAYVGGSPSVNFDPMGLQLVPINLPGLGDTYIDNSVVPALTQFIQYAQQHGVTPSFNSAYRTPLKQLSLLQDPRARTPARRSLHSCGYAFDVDFDTLEDIAAGLTADEQRQVLRDAASQAGLSWGGGFRNPDRRHFSGAEPVGGRVEAIKDALEDYNQFRRETRSRCNSCETSN